MIYSVRSILRLCRTQCILQKKRLNHIRVTSELNNKENAEKSSEEKDFKTLLQKNQDKIIFNSYLEHERLELGHFRYHLKTLKTAKIESEKEHIKKSLPPLPVALQYIVDKEKLLEAESEPIEQPGEEVFQLPFAKTTPLELVKDDTESSAAKSESCTSKPVTPENSEFDKSDVDKWMINYEHYDDTQFKTSDDEWSLRYGTPDPSIGITQVPCGGCGALLHCSEPSIPGYLPSEILRHRKEEELKSMECQRCHFLKEYNIALDVTVQPEEYEKLLQSIRYVKSLVVLMVDLLDFPCSIWPGIVDIIGTERPIIIVGNKVDLLPGDSIGYLKRVRESLLTEINKTKLAEANIKYVSLISAKTGYGVEDLITVMFKEWMYKGDVFLVGCTNVGKSSLFNALLQSDYCKVHAVDIVKRATVSRWPGTTLHLLKFPINRPSGWKIYTRTKRLKTERKLIKMEKEIRSSLSNGRPPAEAPVLIGHIGRSFTGPPAREGADVAERHRRMMGLDERDEMFVNSKWFYDTPGVIHPDQMLSLLSTEELLLTIPKQTIKPQTYYLHQGYTILIGGLARLDHIECLHPCRFTIFCAESLPITVTRTEDADELYDRFVGTELFAVPTGGAKRLSNWPGLEKKREVFEFEGEGPKMCCGDIVLSSVAWVSVTAKGGSICRVIAWTPGARGVHRRYPSLLPYAVNLKGKRVRDTPAYMVGKPFIGQ
ncbi:nitric oxide-associated protein 1 [Ostrinia nubilalis]|uniref:nitric oxide-associated protein 1 n=1 Tax=Ostrinia nubilalis TaxID=29057 RepID=UPI00308231E6